MPHLQRGEVFSDQGQQGDQVGPRLGKLDQQFLDAHIAGAASHSGDGGIQPFDALGPRGQGVL